MNVENSDHLRHQFGLTGLCMKKAFVPSYQMGLVIRKPVLGGLRTTQAQTSLRIWAV